MFRDKWVQWWLEVTGKLESEMGFVFREGTMGQDLLIWVSPWEGGIYEDIYEKSD